MAGHSKFKNIMHRKSAQDARRAKVFARHAREISVASTNGNDPAVNAALRQAILAARAINMPKDRIERAIGAKTDKVNLEDIRYEGYGSCGIAVIVETLTDNKNRTCAGLRRIFSTAGGNLGESGSVSFLFDRVGTMIYSSSIGSVDEVLEVALNCGAEDCVTYNQDYLKFLCSVENFNAASEALSKKFGVPTSLGLTWESKEKLILGEEAIQRSVAFLDALEEHEDVQSVFCNMNYDKSFS